MRAPLLSAFVLCFLVFTMAPAAGESPLLCRRPDAPPLFNNPHPVEGLAKGKFLVAARRLTEPMFAETVILLVGYDQNGAVGLIINRPSGIKLSAILPEIKDEKRASGPVYAGGPVSVHQLFLLVRAGSQPGDSVKIIGNIFVGTGRGLLERATAGPKEGEEFRVYLGYAGWAPGQLEAEVSRGDWHILPADAKTVFEKPAPSIWPELINKASALDVFIPSS